MKPISKNPNQTKQNRGWRDGSAVYSPSCSCKGLGFQFPEPTWWLPTIHNSSPWVSSVLFRPPWALRMHVVAYTCVHTHKQNKHRNKIKEINLKKVEKKEKGRAVPSFRISAGMAVGGWIWPLHGNWPSGPPPPGQLIFSGLPWALLRFGVVQHPEQAFPVSFQEHSSSLGGNGSIQWPHSVSCGTSAGQGAFLSQMSSVAAVLVWPPWGLAATVPGPLYPFLGCWPELCRSYAACLGKSYAPRSGCVVSSSF